MKISIAQRFRPFSHELGASCLLPGTCWSVEAFPVLLRLRSLQESSESQCIEIPLGLHGPVREFTLQQDLEKGCVYLWGVAKEGRFRLRLEGREGEIFLCAEKAPPEGIRLSRGVLKVKKHFSWAVSTPFGRPPRLERLSLGSHRAQDWDLVRRRFDLRELLPVLFHLSQWTPRLPPGPPTGMLHLLNSGFEAFLRAAFRGILTPRLVDEQHQGIVEEEEAVKNGSALDLILEAGLRIRRLFLQQDNDTLSFSFPHEFDCGRMTGIELHGIGVLDFEWSKREIKKAVLRANQDTEVRVVLPRPIASLRLRSSLQERGRRISGGREWSIRAGGLYFLDQFQK